VLDVAVSSAALAVSLPVLGAVALAVRMRLGSPVLFRQPRPGRGGRAFTILKFRTMTDERGPDGQLLDDTARLTAFGRWLRRTSLDELPELLNVLRGEMSLVGPRPLLSRYRPYYSDRERTREDVRPGITGLAQVLGRNHLAWDERLEADARYVESLSLGRDVRILVDTIRAVFGARGVEADARAAMADLDAERALEIRPLGARDAGALVALHRAAFESGELQTTIFVAHGVAEYYADILAEGGEHQALGAFQGKRLVGYAHIRQSPERSHLNQIATDPRVRGRGVGRQLLEAWTAGAGTRLLSLDVTEGGRAASWYRRQGFVSRDRSVVWRVPSASGNGVSLEETETSPRWQQRYGFSTVEAECQGRRWTVGRLGDLDLRVTHEVPEAVLETLRSVRRLLVVGTSARPHPDATPLRAVVRMERAA
jgi:lipopolysaccharide/colanic/teichoic acid biosynthesis glycosyltransferase/ribosomal protein S18 acetylase RimI-like enzyme